jgi:hypothetical protein
MTTQICTKICKNCKEEKNQTDFYKRTNGCYKRRCKRCEIQQGMKYETFTCRYCEITINKKSKNKHDKSHKHLMNYFWGG